MGIRTFRFFIGNSHFTYEGWSLTDAYTKLISQVKGFQFRDLRYEELMED